MKSAPRPWTGAETRLLSEWLASRYPDRQVATHVRVGRLPDTPDLAGMSDAQLRFLGVSRRWVDAVIWLDREILLVEAGILADPGDVSKLELYLQLWPSTPEYAEFSGWPARGHLLYAVPDDALTGIAHRHGLTVEQFSPTWVSSYLAERAPWRRVASP
jgi:hypothetical protein